MTRPTAAPGTSATSPLAPSPGAPELPVIPPDVQKFAEEVGAASYLPGVLAFVRRIIPPEYPVRVMLDCDAEVAEERYVLFDVPSGTLTADEMFTLYRRWSGDIVHYCPASHTYYFRLLLH